MATKSFGIGITIAATGVAKLVSLTPPELTGDVIEATAHDDADRFRRWISTLADWGKVAGRCQTTAANITLIKGKINTDDVALVITAPACGAAGASVTATFVGILTKFQPIGESPVDGQFMCDFEFKVSGDITFGGLT